HPELLGRRRSVLLDLSDPTKGEERNATNRNAAHPGHARVRELMQDDADEKQERRDDRQAPHDSWRPIRVQRSELTRQRERDQPCDDEPAVMQADGNAKPAAEADARLHGISPLSVISGVVPGGAGSFFEGCGRSATSRCLEFGYGRRRWIRMRS